MSSASLPNLSSQLVDWMQESADLLQILSGDTLIVCAHCPNFQFPNWLQDVNFVTNIFSSSTYVIR